MYYPIYLSQYFYEVAAMVILFLDKKIHIGKDCKIGFGEDFTPNEKKPDVLNSGLNVIGKNVKVPDGTIVERNCRIFSNAKASDFESKTIKSGSTLGNS